MRRFLYNYCMALGVSALVLGLSRNTQAQPCPINFPNPPGNVLTTYIIPYPNYPNSPATFSFTVGAGQPLFPGTYYGWCVDANTELDATQGYTVAGTTYTGYLLPDCDPNLNSELPPGHPATCYVSPAVWQEVNYLINHQNGAYFWNVQGAINTLVGGPPISGPGYPTYDTNVVAALVADASNNAAAWVPQCGDLIGVIDVITNQAGVPLTNAVQLVMLEVTNCPVTFTSNTLSLLTNMDLGCNPNPATIPACQNPVNTNIINATSCCGRPLTITCSESDSSVNCKNYRILTYTATDGYGNTAMASQTITWTVDTTIPVIISVPVGENLGANPTNLPTDASIQAQVVVSNTCSVPTIKVTHVDSGTCVMTRTFTIVATDACGNVSAPVTVVYTWGLPCTGIARDDTATIGFWHNKNGQALINAQTPSTALANWLATNFPYLYGANAGANNLTGQNDAAVAALFLKLFGVTGQKTDAQIMAGALAVYVTDSALAGNTAVGYGFNVSATGTGNKTYNVGSNGTAIGLSNNTSYTVLQLLQQVNLLKQKGLYTTSAANAFNNIFSGINQTGDIS